MEEIILKLLRQQFPEPDEISVSTNDDQHFHITIKSTQFQGLPLVKQHQIVYSLLKDKLDSNQIHAVQLTTTTWEIVSSN